MRGKVHNSGRTTWSLTYSSMVDWCPMNIQSIDMMIKFQFVHFSTVLYIWGSLKLSQNSPGCLESKSLLKSRLGLLDTNPDMSRDQLAYLEVVFIFTKGMSYGISHLVNNWGEKAAMGTRGLITHFAGRLPPFKILQFSANLIKNSANLIKNSGQV